MEHGARALSSRAVRSAALTGAEFSICCGGTRSPGTPAAAAAASQPISPVQGEGGTRARGR